MTFVPSFHNLLMGLGILVCINSVGQIKYPVAKKEAFDTVIYNKKLSDEYGRCWYHPCRQDKKMEIFIMANRPPGFSI